MPDSGKQLMFGEILGFALDWRRPEWLLVVVIPLLLHLYYIWRGSRTQAKPAVAGQQISMGFGCAVVLTVGLLFAVLGGYGFWPMAGLKQGTLIPWLLAVFGSLVAGFLTGGWIVLVSVMKNRAGR